jgi:2,3-bisphosphoglycerate-dependent phosphoglycerate mutase
VDTIRDFADRFGHEVTLVDDFRERKVSTAPVRDLLSFYHDQWMDFSHRLVGGECLSEVQDRNIRALKRLLAEHPGENMVVGSHGTALSLIVNYFDPAFDYDRFEEIRELMPWVVKLLFDGDTFLGFESIDVFRK